MKKKIFSIGYEGVGIEEFVEKLRKHSIECLIDVRELPISRKAGFAKTALTSHLHDAGIEYRHFKALGSPKVLRHKLRDDREYSSFFKGVHRHLKLSPGMSAIGESIRTAQEMRSCVMCFCSAWDYCHRRCVVEIIEEQSPLHFEHISFDEQQQSLWGKAA